MTVEIGRQAMVGSGDRSVRLSETFVRLAGTLVTGYDVVELLDDLLSSCLHLVGAAAGGLVLSDQAGNLQVMAASSEDSWLLELFEVQNAQGPCLDCARSGRQIRVTLFSEQRARWPAFASQLRSHGLGAVYALPMRLGRETLGALNLFMPVGAALREADVGIAQALTDVATIALVQYRAVRANEQLIDQLKTALNSRIAIEQAKGVIAEHAHIGMDAAFELLRGHARATQQRLSELAGAIASGSVSPAVLTSRTPAGDG